jgi:Asp/Glu/hydantoin racemase
MRRKALQYGKKAIEDDGADVLIMGCGFVPGINK